MTVAATGQGGSQHINWLVVCFVVRLQNLMRAPTPGNITPNTHLLWVIILRRGIHKKVTGSGITFSTFVCRCMASQTEEYASKGKSILRFFVPRADLRDLFKVELQMRLLYGHRGATADRMDRGNKFEKILGILSTRAEGNDVGTELWPTCSIRMVSFTQGLYHIAILSHT